MLSKHRLVLPTRTLRNIVDVYGFYVVIRYKKGRHYSGEATTSNVFAERDPMTLSLNRALWVGSQAFVSMMINGVVGTALALNHTIY